MDESEGLLVDEDKHTFSWGTHFHIYKWKAIKDYKTGKGAWPKCTICTLPARHGIVNDNAGELSNG